MSRNEVLFSETPLWRILHFLLTEVLRLLSLLNKLKHSVEKVSNKINYDIMSTQLLFGVKD